MLAGILLMRSYLSCLAVLHEYKQNLISYQEANFNGGHRIYLWPDSISTNTHTCIRNDPCSQYTCVEGKAGKSTTCTCNDRNH